MTVVFCQECEQATGTGYFAGKPAHDRHVKSPWNTHQLTEFHNIDDKARWMVMCPRCLDEAADGTPEAGFKTKHLTVCVDENGDEIVQCSHCGKLYHFNMEWTFGTKEVPPKVKEQWLPGRVFLVRRDPQETEVEVYSSAASAAERVKEFEEEVLEAGGYTKIDEDEWDTPFGTRLNHDRAVQQATDENAGDMPDAPEEVDLLS